MFDSLMQLFREMSGGGSEQSLFQDGDCRVAAAALMVQLISVDGVIDEAEQVRLKDVLKKRFSLSDRETAELIAIAHEREKEAVDLYGFTSVLKRELDEDGRIEIIEMMWKLVFADGEIHEFEDNLVWRVAELLGVSRRDRIRMRQSVEAHVDQVPDNWADKVSE